MPTIEVNDAQILQCLDQLSPSGRRAALVKLIAGLEKIDSLIDQNREKLDAICQAKGKDFSRLTEEERETLIDDILHQSH